MLIVSKTDVRLYASGWVVTHPGETRCDFEVSFRTHGEAIEVASNHALACRHTLERRREERRAEMRQAVENDFLNGPSAHRDVVRVPARGGIIHTPGAIEVGQARPPLPAWSDIMPTGPIARIEPSLLDRLRAFGAEFGRAHPRLSVR